MNPCSASTWSTLSWSRSQYPCPIDRVIPILQMKFRKIKSLAQCHRDGKWHRCQIPNATWNHRFLWVKKTERQRPYFKWPIHSEAGLRNTVRPITSTTNPDPSAWQGPAPHLCPAAAPDGLLKETWEWRGQTQWPAPAVGKGAKPEAALPKAHTLGENAHPAQGCGSRET